MKEPFPPYFSTTENNWKEFFKMGSGFQIKKSQCRLEKP